MMGSEDSLSERGVEHIEQEFLAIEFRIVFY